MGTNDMVSRPSLHVVAAVVVVVGLVVGGNVAFGSAGSAPADASAAAPAPLPVSVAPRRIVVHVSGAVQAPGLVTVPTGSRVAAAIAAAGGARRDAALDALNLATEVTDGAHVHVPYVGDAESGSSGGAEPLGVDLNVATVQELESLPGVGPVLAGRIVSHREANGRFDTIEDLLDVPGIGEAKLAQLRDAVRAP